MTHSIYVWNVGTNWGTHQHLRTGRSCSWPLQNSLVQVLIHLWFVKSPILGKIAKQKFVCQPLAPGARTAVKSRAVAVQPAKHRKHEKTAVEIFGNMALKYATKI